MQDSRPTFEEPKYFSSDLSPYGMTYGEWTVKWWIWFLSTPKSRNPVLDDSGKYADVNQPDSDVWFLAGKMADDNSTFPNRICLIPTGRSILFPVINCEANSLEYPELTSQKEIIEHVITDENTIVQKLCTLDGNNIPVHRVASDPPIFKVKFDEDNIYNIVGNKNTVAFGDGYWVFLKPLTSGKHVLSFRGSCENGRLKSGANYVLKVQK